MAAKVLLVRADASAEIGIGHVMRCLALAEAWQLVGGRVLFAVASGMGELESRIRSRGCDLAELRCWPASAEDAAATAELAFQRRADWVVLDGYQFSADYIRALRRNTFRVLAISDGGETSALDCDLIVNSEPGLPERAHSRTAQSVLLGPRYALLRREFLDVSTENREVPDITRKLLVTFGGGDSPNVTRQVLCALDEVSGLQFEVIAVVGPSNPHRASLQAVARESRHRVNLVCNSCNMPELMSQSDLAITAGGGTCFELAFLRIPMFLISMAENQKHAVAAFASARAAVEGGWFNELDTTKLAGMLRSVACNRNLRREIADNAANMVDGKGAERIVETMLMVGERSDLPRGSRDQ
ncbi:MAG TPA: UDP-2,4-diacetamido-2,4,6-trideoxy-beta-L-altropyranose hydrolase [Candidatus Sulfotelmatobacter sp.]|nr:UDP-2,4-diacetamido-2,4,6-trideoxy-beta-L-altropyranose hydrolase [Candidatus Sulfotelmatobacter sp.]